MSAHHIIPTGWSRRSSPIDPSVVDCLCCQTNVGLYDGEKDLRHMGEGELFLTPTILSISLPDVKPDPQQPASVQKQQQQGPKSLFLEMPLSTISSFRHIGGFVMFSSPKVQLVLQSSDDNSPLPRISFRNGGIEFFEKQLEQALKKKAWLASATATAAVSTTTTSAAKSASLTNSTGADTQSKKHQHHVENTAAAAAAFCTNRAGVAGVVAMQAEKADALRQSIRSATGEVDELIVKSKQLSALMERFREEVAKGAKLLDSQVDQLKRLDSRFAAQQQEQHDDGHEVSNSGRDLHHSPLYQPKRNATATELANELQEFLRSDSVLRGQVRVPLVELLAAFNTYRGFSYEIAPQQFHACLVDGLVRHFPPRSFSLLHDDPVGCATVPSFSLEQDHLVQWHVLPALVTALEKGPLGVRPMATTGDDNNCFASLSTFRTAVTASTAPFGGGCSLDEAHILLLMLESEGVLMRDSTSGTVSWSWNAFLFV